MVNSEFDCSHYSNLVRLNQICVQIMAVVGKTLGREGFCLLYGV